MVLDEPNANLDGPSELLLLDLIRRLKADGVTLVIIAHKPSILQDVDKLLVLGNGKQLLFGPREAVLQRLEPPVGWSSRRPKRPLAVQQDEATAMRGGPTLFSIPFDETGEATRIVRAGMFILIVFVGGFFTWSWLAPISGAVIADGIVKIDTNRKTLQHLEGGSSTKSWSAKGTTSAPAKPC